MAPRPTPTLGPTGGGRGTPVTGCPGRRSCAGGAVRPAVTRRALAVAGFGLVLAGCQTAERLWPDREPLSPHGRYAAALRRAGLDSAALGKEWLDAADSVLAAPVPVVAPFQESGHYVRSEARAVAYRVPLTDGQLLTVRVSHDSGRPLLFVDLFLPTGDSAAPFRYLASSTPDSAAGSEVIRYEARETRDYVVRLQPELLRSGQYHVVILVGPTLAFPVDGHDARAVRSLFGADRDGGRRRHHGIDIFAPRGTPVLAAASGVVRSTRPNDLGGNVVWLSDPSRGQSMYYAHLDSGIVGEGQRVEVGDTLGFVGNSGNARTTKPHLHFGIYRRGEGPVDPYPFVRQVKQQPDPVVADARALGAARTIRATRVALRASPALSSETLSSITSGTRVRVVGAASSYYRVLQENGVAGYVPARTTAP